MKKIVLTLITFLFVVAVHAQTEKGKKLIGGQVNFTGSSSSHLDANSTSKRAGNSMQFDPNFGYFIKENLAVGVILNIGYSNNMSSVEYLTQPIYNYTNSSTALTLGAGIFANKYIKLSEKLFFVLHSKISYAMRTDNLVESYADTNHVYTPLNPEEQEIQGNTLFVGLSPGLNYFLSPKLGVHAYFGNIYYSNTTSTNKTLLNDNHDNANFYGVNLNPSTLYFGLNYFF